MTMLHVGSTVLLIMSKVALEIGFSFKIVTVSLIKYFTIRIVTYCSSYSANVRSEVFLEPGGGYFVPA